MTVMQPCMFWAAVVCPHHRTSSAEENTSSLRCCSPSLLRLSLH